jgi:hypothetical protein
VILKKLILAFISREPEKNKSVNREPEKNKSKHSYPVGKKKINLSIHITKP